MILYQIFALLINQMVVWFECRYDIFQRQKLRKNVHHTASAWFRGMAWIITAVLLHIKLPWLQMIGYSTLFCLLLGFQYWLTFNLFHNYITNHKWYYGNNGFFDSILPGEKNRFKNIGLKLGLFIITGFLYLSLNGVKE
jgi:lipopolysaccharide export LptBFGC system permease protein LptF